MRRKIPFVLVVLFGALGLMLQACGTGSASGLTTGASAPEFRLPSTEGDTVALSNYVGNQPTLLYFHMAMG